MKASSRVLRCSLWAVSSMCWAACGGDPKSTPRVSVELRDAGQGTPDAAVLTDASDASEGGMTPDAGPPTVDAAVAMDGGPTSTDDGSVSTIDAAVDATEDATVDASGDDGGDEPTEDASGAPGVQIGPTSSTQALVRIANWVPDSPATGYDVCLAPAGTMAWIGPILAQDFDAGALGEGGPNGIQFPNCTAYVSLAPGQYDLQVVLPGTGCSTGIMGTTSGLPFLSAGSATTFAVTGTVHQIDNDSPMKISPLSDETAGVADGALLRFVNADPTLASVVLGTGDPAQGTFVALFPDAPYAVPASVLADGGATDSNGYALVAPFSGQELSVQPLGSTTDLTTAAHATAAAGTVTTLVLINGADEGSSTVAPPQLMACIDSAQPAGALSQCTVLIPE